jgi:hypothetical protein
VLPACSWQWNADECSQACIGKRHIWSCRGCCRRNDVSLILRTKKYGQLCYEYTVDMSYKTLTHTLKWVCFRALLGKDQTKGSSGSWRPGQWSWFGKGVLQNWSGLAAPNLVGLNRMKRTGSLHPRKHARKHTLRCCTRALQRSEELAKSFNAHSQLFS